MDGIKIQNTAVSHTPQSTELGKVLRAFIPRMVSAIVPDQRDKALLTVNVVGSQLNLETVVGEIPFKYQVVGVIKQGNSNNYAVQLKFRKPGQMGIKS